MVFNRFFRNISNALSLNKESYGQPLKTSEANEKVPGEPFNQEQRSGLVWKNLLAGAVAGAVSRTTTAPIDRLKIYCQVHGSTHGNLLNIFRSIRKEGGLQSLWRGNGISVLKVAPETAIKFAAYEQIKRLISDIQEKGNLQLSDKVIAGSLAGAVTQTSIHPMEVLKVRMAMRMTGQYCGIADCARKIFQREGIRAFYRGYVPSSLGIIPSTGVDLALYETLRNTWLQRNNSANPGVMVPVACGSISCTCATLVSYPLVLVRTRIQAEALLKGTRSLSMRDVLWRTVTHEGVAGLYCGLIPCLMKVVPAVTITYVVVEHMRRILGVGTITGR